MMLVPHWLEKRASLTPNRTAMITSQGELSFAQLRNQARSWAQKLAVLGVQSKNVPFSSTSTESNTDSVALLCSNGQHMLELIHALTYLDATLLPLNTRLTVDELRYQLQDANSTLLVYDQQYVEIISELRTQLSTITFVSVDELATVSPLQFELKTNIDLRSFQAIMYTSGTTGVPKGVLLSYSNYWSSAIGSMLNLGLSEQDCWLVCVPLFHISGLSILMRSVIYGIPIIIHKTFDPSAVNDAIVQQGVTIVSVVSNMLDRMVTALEERNYPSSFRCMLLGGGPAPLSLLERCVDKGIPVFQTYGMTETASQIATLQPEYMLTKLGSAGKPLFQAELRIIKDGKKASPLESGEITVRGPHVTTGYLHLPEATAEAIVDGWLFTGDVGYLDEDGFLYVQDRRKDMFISGGENVYPAEIEAALASHPNVVEAGVTSVADERWGKRAIAFIRVNEIVPLTEQEIIHYLTEKLAKYKIPSRIYIVDQPLPRNAANKLLRRELMKLIPNN